jgi:hypothetical protein
MGALRPHARRHGSYTGGALKFMKRAAISKRIRFNVFKRDGFICQYCGSHPPDVILEVDHIEPICDGGKDDEENLITACFNCNRGKAGIPLSTAPQSLAEQATKIRELEDQIAGYREVINARWARLESDMWEVAETLSPGSGTKGFRRDWLQSIKMFNRRLPLHEVIDAAEIAIAKKPGSESWAFKYFCGICWNKIRDGEPRG